MANVGFSAHVSPFASWQGLYSVRIDFDIDFELDTDTRILTCTIPPESIKTTPQKDEENFDAWKGDGFLDVLIATWRFTDEVGLKKTHGAPNYANENISYVENQIFSDFPEARDNFIVGYWFKNSNWNVRGQLNSTNYRKQFKLADLQAVDDFNVINDITRSIQPGANVTNMVGNNVVSFDVKPYMKYYPLSIRKKNVFESCNRFGPNNRTGFLKLRKGDSWKDEFNSFITTEPQTFYMNDGSKHVIAPITGENSGE